MPGLYLPPVLKGAEVVSSAPDDHFAASPRLPCDSLGQWARWSCWWPSNYPCRDCISRRCSNRLSAIISAPDDHFTASPDRRVILTGQSGALVVLVAVQLSVLGLYLPPVFKYVGNAAAHPRRSFHCQSTLPCDRSASGRVGGAGGRPTIGAGIVSPAGVEIACRYVRPRRSFHCQSRLPCDRIGQRARWWCWWLSNYRCWDCICRRC